MSRAATRRAVLGALALAPVAIAAPVVAAGADAALMAAWARYMAAQRVIYAPGSNDDTCSRVCAALVDAEEAIRRLPATTPRGAAVKLLVALPHLQNEWWIENAIAHSDYQALFDREHELDFGPRLTVGALRTLMQAGGMI